MNILFLNMPTGSPVYELHASISKMKKIDAIASLSKNQHYCHVNPTGSKLYTDYRIRKEDEIKSYFKTDKYFQIGKVLEQKKISLDLENKLKLGSLSSLNSYIRIKDDREIPLIWKRTYKEFLNLSISIYWWFYEFSKDHDDLRLFCFNGRFCEERSAIEAIKLGGKNFTVYDIKDHYSKTFYIFEDESLHSYRLNSKRAKKFYIENCSQARIISEDFIQKKISGKATYEPSYTSHQNRKFHKFNNGKKIISIFPSSDDEYRFLGEEWNDLVVDQVSEIRDFIKEFNKIDEKIIFIIKLHPNMKLLRKQSLNRYYDLKKLNNTLVEKPNSRINTYSLINKSDYVLVFCSTVGVEANYLRKKTVGIAGSPYYDIPVLNKTKSGIEAARIIINKKTKMKSKRASIIWMNYLWKYSDPNPFIIKDSKFNKKFKINRSNIDFKSRLKIVPARIKLICIQMLTGVFPDLQRIKNLKKILVGR